MQIPKISAIYNTNNFIKPNKFKDEAKNSNTIAPNEAAEDITKKSFYYVSNVRFGEFFDPNRTVPHIDYEEYCAMSVPTKQRFRKRYQNFRTDKLIDKKDLVDQNFVTMPLQTEKEMDEFIKISSIYNEYKGHPILCLGRSPKWFLNASLWMKDGIDDYKFVAFSKFWYIPDYRSGIRRIDSISPNKEQINEYRKYLKRIEVDPKSLVEKSEKIGKKIILTDYICSGKGASSFLEIMADYAEEQNVLDRFAKNLKIVGIGSMEYMEELAGDYDEISIPKVIMPEKLIAYTKDIEQKYYDMEYFLFRNMLLNQNTNECRSTYYPREMWTIYRPDQFKTGLIRDVKRVKELLKRMKGLGDKSMSSFTPAMYDYRNLLNFRILDALNARKILKNVHRSKI